MKKFKFKDGTIVEASSKEEAIHKIIAASDSFTKEEVKQLEDYGFTSYSRSSRVRDIEGTHFFVILNKERINGKSYYQCSIGRGPSLRYYSDENIISNAGLINLINSRVRKQSTSFNKTIELANKTADYLQNNIQDLKKTISKCTNNAVKKWCDTLLNSL